ncbi:MAG: aminoglycoside phosphotransferase family protein [Acidimicrobiales bacterium]|nr:aminoglycoside phosphotransferase family protein [Acidimicrobiales bacterium]
MTAAPTPSLEWLAGFDDGRRWLDALPQRVDHLSRLWSFEVVGPPFDGGMCGLVLPVVAHRNGDAVLKIQFPHPECVHEADALRAWNGTGAVRLLDHDATNDALLLERCTPGHALASDAGADAVAVMAELVLQLAVPSDGPFVALADEAQRWRRDLPVNWNGNEGDLVENTIELIDELVSTQGPQVLVHQDLHGLNVLAAARQPWLAIDPKPLMGELAFALAPIVRSDELGHGRAAVIDRLDALSSAVGVDRERARKWTIVQTMAWGTHLGEPIKIHLEIVRWLLDA